MKKPALILLLLSLSGCATLFSDKTQVINLKVVDQDDKRVTGVSCVVTDPRGESSSVTDNPGTALIRKGGFTHKLS